MTTWGSATALGFGGLLKRQHSRGRKNSQQKD
ncbi:PEP-CTERM sorting domain-containing protein [Coleofasciculus chthonoplastes]